MKYEDFKSDKEFRAWLRKNKLLMSQYFIREYPRKDKYSGQQIPFKNQDQYFKQDFISKKNMALWLAEQSLTDAKQYIKDVIAYRQHEKGLKYFPSEIECSSVSGIPSLRVCSKYVDLHGLSSYLGLKTRFDYAQSIQCSSPLQGLKIGIDSREQQPLDFPCETINTKFDFGDYCFMSEEDFSNVFIERKSIADLWNTISGGYDRFNREIKRAQNQSAYLIVLVEYGLVKALEYNRNRRLSKANAAFVFKRIRDLMQKYDNLQFAFVNSREESTQIILNIASLGADVKKLDLQYYINKKELPC